MVVAQPRLIHPVKVTVEIFDPSLMLMDNDAREPIKGMRSSSSKTFVIDCQVHFDKFGDPQAEIGGVVTTSIGYFLARSLDMDRVLGNNVRLKRRDRITGYQSRNGAEFISCDLYITRGDPIGHYPDRGATMYKYHVEDRDPVQ